MNRWSLIMLFLILKHPVVWAQDCVPAVESCDFYMCSNQELNCGPQNYLVDFGYKYCRKFVNNEAHFSIQAQETLREIRYCLQEKLYFEQKLTCETSQSFAIQHHVDCYVEKGFCELSVLDKLQIFSYIRKTILDPAYLKTMLQIQRSCSYN